MKVLIDTCVVIDSLQDRKPFSEDANSILLLAANNQFTGCVTAKSLTDIYYLVHRHTHSDEATRAILSKLLTIYELLDTEAMDCKRALLSSVSDLEDAVMAETALREEIDCIVTRNQKDYAKSGMLVYSPKEFLSLIQDNNYTDM